MAPSKWFYSVDLSRLVLAVVFYLVWSFSSTLPPIERYNPEHDSRFSYPRAKTTLFPRRTLENIAVFYVLGLYLVLWMLSSLFPAVFPEIKLFTVIWASVICVSSSGIITNLAKSYVGFPRPDMYSICGANANYTTCTDQSKRDKEFISWPSSHACTAMSVSTFLALLLQTYFRKFPLASTLLSLVSVAFGVFVGGTRIVEHKHHPADVNAGFFIGALVSVIIYSGSKEDIFGVSPKMSTPTEFLVDMEEDA